MKKLFIKSFTIRKLTISFMFNELLLVYRGSHKIYIKRYPIFGKFSIKAAIYVLVCCFAFMGLYAFSSIFRTTHINGNEMIKEQAQVESDQELMQKIVQSRETEYSDPIEIPKKVEVKLHRVKSGETLSKIARMYGVSMETICGSNNLQSFDLVPVGLMLKIPLKEGILYRVKNNENLSSIASRFKLPVERIIAANEIRNVDFLQPNMDIFIPDAKPQNLVRGFIWPTLQKHGITSGYGWRNHPIFDEKHFHTGLDIYCKYGWIRAAKFGKVTYTGWLGGYGKTIIISHPGGWKTLYGHLSRISVKTGQYVKQGQFIGKSGNTGNSTGPHLHFEIISNGEYKNPRKMIK